jgi:hypothetical protein
MQKPATLRLLRAANWILLGVSWGMSLYAYARLPEEMASWPSVWQFDQAMMGKSVPFFLNPVLQTVFFFGFLALIRKLLIQEPRSPGEDEPPDDLKAGRLRGLRNEVACLALIFFNLIFIHLQTSRILVSHRLATGINKTYFIMLFLVLIILVPYYRLRRQILLREQDRPSSRS